MTATGICPDQRTCHHRCGPDECFRVRNCDPFPGAYPDDTWPAAVAQQLGGSRTGRVWPIGKTVRVYLDNEDDDMVTGQLVAVIGAPVFIIIDDEGARHHVAASLRTEVQHTEWRPL